MVVQDLSSLKNKKKAREQQAQRGRDRRLAKLAAEAQRKAALQGFAEGDIVEVIGFNIRGQISFINEHGIHLSGVDGYYRPDQLEKL